MKMRTVFVACVLMMAGVAQAARVMRVEPPSPHLEKPFKDVRQEQLTFRERLEEWGVKVEPKYKGVAEESGCEVKLEVKWTGPDEITMELGARSPQNVTGFEAEGKYMLRVMPDELGQGGGGA